MHIVVPTHIVLCFYVVFLRLEYPILPVSLGCTFILPLRYSLAFLNIHDINIYLLLLITLWLVVGLSSSLVWVV